MIDEAISRQGDERSPIREQDGAEQVGRGPVFGIGCSLQSARQSLDLAAPRLGLGRGKEPITKAALRQVVEMFSVGKAMQEFRGRGHGNPFK